MGADNTLGLLFAISADPTKAQVALDGLKAKAAVTGQSIGAVNAEIAASAVAATAAMRNVGDVGVLDLKICLAELQQQARDAFANIRDGIDKGLGPQQLEPIKQEWSSLQGQIIQTKDEIKSLGSEGATGIRGMFPALTEMRGLTRLAMGVFAVGFIISGLSRLIAQIETASLAVGGFSEESQKAYAANVKANLKELEIFQGLTVQAKIADGQMKIFETNRRLANEEAIIEALNQATSFKQYLLALSQGTAAIAVYAGTLGALNAADAERAILQQRLIVQSGELGKLEKELNRAHVRSAKAAHEYSDALKAMLENALAEANALKSEQLPALQRIQAEYQKQVDAATRAVEADRKLYAQHKISAQQVATEEKEFDSTIVALRDAMWSKMATADATNLAARVKRAEEAGNKEVEAEKKEAAALQRLRAEMEKTAAQSAKLAADFDRDGMKVSAAFDRMQQEEDRYAGRAEADKTQVINAHKAMTDAAAQHLVREALVLSQLSGDWMIYANAVKRAQDITTQAAQDATSAQEQQLAGTAKSIAGMLGLEKEFVIAEAAFKIPKYIGEGLASLALVL